MKAGRGYTRFTLDASVFLSAFLPGERDHAASRLLVDHLSATEAPLFEPTLLLTEIAAALARRHGDVYWAKSFADKVRDLPHLMFVPLDESFAMRAARFAAENSLRGADAVYAAVAVRFDCLLVTLDKQQLTRSKLATETLTPAAAAERLGLGAG